MTHLRRSCLAWLLLLLASSACGPSVRSPEDAGVPPRPPTTGISPAPTSTLGQTPTSTLPRVVTGTPTAVSPPSTLPPVATSSTQPRVVTDTATPVPPTGTLPSVATGTMPPVTTSTLPRVATSTHSDRPLTPELMQAERAWTAGCIESFERYASSRGLLANEGRLRVRLTLVSPEAKSAMSVRIRELGGDVVVGFERWVFADVPPTRLATLADHPDLVALDAERVEQHPQPGR